MSSQSLIRARLEGSILASSSRVKGVDRSEDSVDVQSRAAVVLDVHVGKGVVGALLPVRLCRTKQ